MNILRRELKANSKSLLIWMLSLAAFNFSMMALYPSFAIEAGDLEKFIDMFPEGFMRAFGLDRLNLTDILGYYATEGYTVFILAGSIYAMLLGSSLLSKEEDDRTIEFLLAKPVTRNQIVCQMLWASVISLFLLNIAVAAATFAGFEIYKQAPYSRTTLLWLSMAPFLLQVTFAHIGLVLSLMVTRKKSIYAIGLGLVLSLYLLGLLAEASDKLAFISRLTLFKSANATDIVVNGRMSLLDVGLFAGLNGVLVAILFKVYQHKDMRA